MPIRQVAERHLCSGCGVCSFLEPDRFRMVDTPSRGRLPLTVVDRSGQDGARACPGSHLEHPPEALEDAPWGGEWGPVLRLYEGWATDPDVRFRGSSGGVVTALATHALTDGDAAGVLHVVADPDDPLRNRAVVSRTPQEVQRGAGSRYSPASPLERLDEVAASPAPSVVVGKPCDVAGVRGAIGVRPDLADKVALTIGIFCAGTPSTRGTRQTLELMGVDPDAVSGIRYRGHGWPGRFTAEVDGQEVGSLSYEESWGGPLQQNRIWRCMICPDHTGEFADLSVGDPWYRTIEDGEPGRSLVVVRTARGQAAVEAAIRGGAVDLVEVPLDRLPRSQPNLIRTRGAVWGRVGAMRALRLPFPRYVGLPMAAAWWRELSLKDKGRSTLGTVRRVYARGLNRPQPVQPSEERSEG